MGGEAGWRHETRDGEITHDGGHVVLGTRGDEHA